MIHEEIARADLSMSYINLLASLNGQILSHHGAPEVVEAVARALTAGEALFAIALTEPRGGSDAANLRLRIERDGGDYVLNGEKTSISAADQADAAVVFGRTGSVESGAQGVTALLVPMDLPGVTPQPLRLSRPARHRPRLAVLRQRARARLATASAPRTRASSR